MEELLEDYKRRLATIQQTISRNQNNGSISDIQRATRLATKAAEYRTFISELEMAIKNDGSSDRLTSELMGEVNRLRIESGKKDLLIKELSEALEACMGELYSIHSQYGDKQNARDHSHALQISEETLKKVTK